MIKQDKIVEIDNKYYVLKTKVYLGEEDTVIHYREDKFMIPIEFNNLSVLEAYDNHKINYKYICKLEKI